MQDIKSRLSERFLSMPWAVLLPLWLLLPFMMAGAVRFVLGTSLELGLLACGGFALLLLGSAVWFGFPRLTPTPLRSTVLVTAIGSLLLVAFTYRLWWSPVYYGMPNTVVGVDVGNHTLLYQRFLADPIQYEGFVSLYALMHWYRTLLAFGQPESTSIYYALRFAHYAFLLSVPVALALVVYPTLAPLRATRDVLLTFVLSLIVQGAVLAVLVFPVLQYYQAEGFYSQIAGIYPLMFGWLTFALFEGAGARFIACMAWVVIQRFSYGLNLGDTLLTLAYLWIWDSAAIKSALLRWGARLFVPVGVFGAYMVYEKLYPLRFMHGWFHNQSVPYVTAYEILAALALLSAPAVLSSVGVVVSPAQRRLWSYAGCFGFVNATMVGIYFAYGEPLEYYVLKYSMYAVVIESLALAGPLSAMIAGLVTREWQWRSLVNSLRVLSGVVALSALLVFVNLQGYFVYRAMAKERFGREVPNAVLHTHFEPAVEKFIDTTLKKHHKQFGGYYDILWARMFLINTLHWVFWYGPDHPYNRRYEAADRMFITEPNRCYFYIDGPSLYHGGPGAGMNVQIAEWHQQKTDCTSFRPAWRTEDLHLCASCR